MFISNRYLDIRQGFLQSLKGYYDVREASMLFRRMMEHLVGKPLHEIHSQPGAAFSESILRDLMWAIKDLQVHKPWQYIIGEVSFHGLDIKVNPAVLIPRPETEELVDHALYLLKFKVLRDRSTSERIAILDACTGSGCVALALKKELPDAEVMALDKSEKALDLARENASRLGLDIALFLADILEAIPKLPPLDLIVSNPPYVLNSERDLMLANVLHYEPAEALFVPDSAPLIFYEALARWGKEALREGGLLVTEINEKFSKEVSALFLQNDYKEVICFKDFRGKDRFVHGSWEH